MIESLSCIWSETQSFVGLHDINLLSSCCYSLSHFFMLFCARSTHNPSWLLLHDSSVDFACQVTDIWFVRPWFPLSFLQTSCIPAYSLSFVQFRPLSGSAATTKKILLISQSISLYLFFKKCKNCANSVRVSLRHIDKRSAGKSPMLGQWSFYDFFCCKVLEVFTSF